MTVIGKCPKDLFLCFPGTPSGPVSWFPRNLRVLLGTSLWEIVEEIAGLSLEARAEVEGCACLCVHVCVCTDGACRPDYLVKKPLEVLSQE